MNEKYDLRHVLGQVTSLKLGMPPTIANITKCYHCGETCQEAEVLHFKEKHFCCQGCQLVFEMLDQNGMCDYYDISKTPGVTQKMKVRENKFSYLEDVDIQRKLIHFQDINQTHVAFYIPQMHCSSCIWLLENLPKIHPGILQSNVNFPRREVTIAFSSGKVTLREVVETLTKIGYEPHISLNEVESNKVKRFDRSRTFKVGVAGFCFGNIMMLSFPEYFSLGKMADAGMKQIFSYLNLSLALPVFLYCASEFYISAWKGMKQKFLNIDAPIVLAIVMTFGRSAFDILTHSGPGYLDSMSGVVFFMLIGRIFQDRTYQTLSFERDYKSFFPVAVTVKKDGVETNIPISKLKIGDRILVRQNELIPADAILFYGKANIDYSFVTGESAPVERSIGEIIYAGGRQQGTLLELEVVKEVSQSYLTQLWNKEAFHTNEEKGSSFIHKLSRQFTWLLFAIAATTFGYWFMVDKHMVFNAVTSVLLIACPCALLLSATFTNGNMLRIFGKNHFYLRSSHVIENLATCNTIIFDKTGTITQSGKARIQWQGKTLDHAQLRLVYHLVSQSNHPLSNEIATFLKSQLNESMHESQVLDPIYLIDFAEHVGRGLTGNLNGIDLQLGSAKYLKVTEKGDGGSVYLAINHEVHGCFRIQNQYRQGFETIVQKIKTLGYQMGLVSGDNAAESAYLHGVFGVQAPVKFQQSPEDKLGFIAQMQQQGNKIIMIGDGLNDAGALKVSDVGIAVSDHVNNFSPACDGILSGDAFEKLPSMLRFAKAGKRIIMASFIVSVLYNAFAMYFAVQGALSPVLAAILMPISSISIVVFTTGLSSLSAKRLHL